MAINFGKLVGGIGKQIGAAASTAVKVVGSLGNPGQIGTIAKEYMQTSNKIFTEITGKPLSGQAQNLGNSLGAAAAGIAANPGSISLASIGQSIGKANSYNTGIVLPAMNSNSRDQYAQEVANLYRQVLEREPDRGGLMNWVGERERGMSITEVERHFRNSPEYATLQANKNKILTSSMLPTTGIAQGQNISYSTQPTKPNVGDQVQKYLDDQNKQPEETLWDKIKRWSREKAEIFYAVVIGVPALIIGLVWWMQSKKRGRKSYRR